MTLSAPVSTARDTRSARPTSRVQSEPDSPYSVSLASRIASSSSRNGNTLTTGPKISSRQCRSAFERASNTVGGNHHPFASGAVPVLVEGEAVIFDSLAIMEYANDLAGGRLWPSDPLARATARSLFAWQHAGLSGLCARLSFESAFYEDRRVMTAGEREEASRFFELCEHALLRSGGPWLAGELSLADLALVPTVVRLLAHSPDLEATPEGAAWAQRLMARPAVEEWMAEARVLPPVWLDDY